MKTRKEVLEYGLSFPDTYQEAPFHDTNWQLVRVKGSKKAFLWTERLYQFKCQGRPGMAGFLAADIYGGDSGVASE